MTTAAEMDELFSDDGYKAPKGHMELLYEANPELRRQHELWRIQEMQAERAQQLQAQLDEINERRRKNLSGPLYDDPRY